MRTLSVWVNDREVGSLGERTETGLIDFSYASGIAPDLAVSLTMPVGVPAEEYTGFNGLPPPFEVSLPEGVILDALRRRFLKLVDVDDDFSLLQIVGRHTMGRVTFGGPLELDSAIDAQILAAARSENSAKLLAETLQHYPQTAGLSGVMPKMSTRHKDAPDRPGTMIGDGTIVKFDTPEFCGAALVEFACLTACRMAGLEVPDFHLSPDASALVIPRFDVAPDGRRLGFEDACALSGLRRTGKYRGTVEDLFRMIEHFVPSGEQAAARRDLFSRLLLNDVLRNGDAHLKNFGLVYDDLSRPRLSPVYDVLTTQAWIRNDLPALRMGSGDAGPQWLTESSLDRLAELARVPEAARQLAASFKEVAVHAMRSVLDQDIARVNPAARVALERASQIVQGAWMHRES
ncbi:MAG: type II toxin-antitoxin system HipA family toxin [Acidiferrobacterales bacterium]